MGVTIRRVAEIEANGDFCAAALFASAKSHDVRGGKSGLIHTSVGLILVQEVDEQTGGSRSE